MRYVVLLIGLAGLVGSGVLGYIWMDNFSEMKEDISQKRLNLQQGQGNEKDPAWIAEQERRGQAWPFLFAGAGLGLFGSLLAYERHRFCGAALLLAAPVGGLVFHPFDYYLLSFASGLVLAGLLALFIRPHAAAHPRARTLAPAN